MDVAVLLVVSLAGLALSVALLLVPFQILGVLRDILVELRLANMTLDLSDAEDDDDKATVN
jgi:hypothetical protein